MIPLLPGLLALVVSGAGAYESGPSPSDSSVLTAATDTVRVAPPTGAAATDRANIIAALAALEPGGTLLFAAGTYWIGGAFIRVPVPGVILQGHPDGTILRGCEPADLVEHERMAECNGLELTGPRQTIRGFTFEQIGSALWVGCCLEPAAPDLEGGQPHVGGHLIEGNTFRGTWNGIRVIGDSPEAAVIRDNDFVNTWHAVTVNGRTAHILGNRVSVPDPEQVPVNGHAGIAIAVIAHDTRAERAFTCAGNVIAGNRIEGHPEAIGIFAFQSGASCRENVIRDNTIAATRVRFPEPSWGVIGIRDQTDSTLAGVPIALADLSAQMAEFMGLPAGDQDEDLIHENRIEGNRVTGAEGLAIQLVGASRNRLVGNTITGVRRWEPFPGNTMIDDPEPWRDANGSGIWISPGSDGNVVAGNAFDDVAGAVVSLEGDGNRVELDTVRVAPPTGDAQEDRAAILEALEAAGPGGTLRFGPGTYLTGGTRITVTTPGVTLVGDADGTVIRGCDRATLDTLDVATMRQGRCAGLFALQGGRQAVRSMTLEGVHTALDLGWIAGQGDAPGEDGGYNVEDVTFRRVSKGVNVMGQWAEVATIRDNTFLNVYHAITLQGGTSHVLDNHISAPEPGTVFYQGFPGGAISALAAPECGENVIAGNRIEGHPDGIIVGTLFPGTSCRNNIIRNNVIDAGRVTFRPDAPGRSLINVEHEDDRTVTGVPITILNAEGEDGVPAGAPPGWQGPAFSGNHVIEGNRVLGAAGLGIQIRRSSGNRVANNFIEAVVRREPFPGNHLHLHPGPWEPANGSGIWISAGSDENEVAGNSFDDIAASAIVIEGDSNQVELQSTDDAVRDLGTGNRVTRAATAEEWTDPSPHEIRYVTVAPDVRLEVLDWGGDGLPLVFLAGANFNAHSFDDFAPRFTDTHRVLGITRRGHGASSWPDSGYDLPTLVEDIRLVLDSLGIDRAILAGHSMAGAEMTLLATESPDRVAGLIYIDAGHDPTDIGRLRVEEHCSSSFSPGFLEAMERTFENPELVRRTQWQTGEHGVRRPFAAAAALAGIDASLPTPDYSGVVAPALGIYYVPERTEDLFMGLGDPAAACVAAFHRYIHGGIAAFMEGVEQATVIPLSETNHNIHLASPDTLEAVMRRWLATVPGLASPSAAQRSDAVVGQHDLGVRLDSAIALIAAFQDTSGVVGLSAAIAVDGRLIWSGGYGYVNLQHRVEAGPEMVSRIGSVSKPVSAVLAMILAEQGLLDLDAPIGTYLPEYPDQSRSITTRQLLSHTSGIRHYEADEAFSSVAYDDVLEPLTVFSSDSLLFDPGSAFGYSTHGYTVVSAIPQRIAGRPWPELLEQLVAQPLGLRTLQPERHDRVFPNHASFYRRSSDGVAVNAPHVDQSNVWAGGGLLATAADLVNFAIAVADGSLLGQAAMDEMWRQQTPGERDPTYGLGWVILERGGRRLVGHSGGTPGATAMLLLAPDDRAAVAILSNTEVVVANLAELILGIFLTDIRE